MQFIAVLLVSFAMVVFVLTLFRPARGGCCSVKTVAVIGASLMTGFAFFQMLAFVLMIVIEKDLDGECVCAGSGLENPRFGVAASATATACSILRVAPVTC